MSEQLNLAAKRLRMLRLGEGWTAEKLSQEYAKAGAGALTRTTIAKIEGGNRQIKADELEAVARVFGLTSADLLGSDGPSVLLSYAEQDSDIGQEISAWLSDHGFQVLSASQPADGGVGASSGATRAIDSAQAFVVLLTPNFLSSPRCQEDLDLARPRAQELLSAGRPGSFVYVVRIPDAPSLDYSGLSPYSTIEMPTADKKARQAALNKLGSGIVSSARASAARSNQPVQVQANDELLGRGEELERVLYALRDPSGAHFWLVISPPGFGKSWFLGQLETRAAEPESGGWAPKMIDLRSADLAGPDATGHEHDAMTLVRRLFDLEQAQSSEPADDLVAAAQKIIRQHQPWLCLLDSAEVLPAGTVAELRQHLGEIDRLIQKPGTADARLAVVVASRQDGGWTGLTPRPRLSVLPLAEFGANAVLGALEELAGKMHRVHSRAELLADAALVQRVTEGMPELVRESLEWIRAQEWLAIERLENPQLFAEIIAPYIEDRLLAQGSLLPAQRGQAQKPTKQLAALQSAVRALVLYRFITPAHVRYHQDNDCSFREALQVLNWSADDLWRATGDMALLFRPLPEPWQKIHPAIRRLLYRYFYSPGDLAEAHARARDFTRQWAGLSSGTDQVVGMVEVIWHEAARLRLNNEAGLANKLPEFAREQPREIRCATMSSTYNKAGLRDYAIRLMEADDELQREVANVDGLFDDLIRAIQASDAWEE